MVQHNPAWSRPDASAPEGFSRIAVDVTFLRMPTRPEQPGPRLPADYQLLRVPAPTVGFYRYLYGTVGHDYCWWLRRAAGDAELAALLADPATSIHVLYHGGEPGGFFELDARARGEVNISYFGLMPHQVGRGVGGAFLRAAIDAGWALIGPAGGGLRVNTCTADHPRALGRYIQAGFRPTRSVREVWNIPDRLGLPIPGHLRA